MSQAPLLPGLFCPLVLLPSGWARDTRLEFDRDGNIDSIHTNSTADGLLRAAGPVIPGMANVHSHAFQRALAGLAERCGPNDDSFWTWRTTMYDFVAQLTPETLHTIATQLYIDMLKNGYTAVGEFHYLHHQPDGTPYTQRSELSQQVIEAAINTGIGITHLPVLYRYSGFGASAPHTGQRRFINNHDEFFAIVQDLQQRYQDNPQVRIGIAPHSLRAVSPTLLTEAVNSLQTLDSHAPIHIHIAEQQQEVQDCLAWSGQRPVQWLLAQLPIDERWCLIHATHMNTEEILALANSRATAGLCPTTEANLGDGFFSAADFFAAQGRFAIGSDSQVSISPTEELRLLEYGQRLLKQQRNVLRCTPSTSIGAGLYRAALIGGAQALSRPIGQIVKGYRADLVVLDQEQPLLQDKTEDLLLDTYVFCSGQSLVRDVFVGGRQLISEGRHLNLSKH